MEGCLIMQLIIYPGSTWEKCVAYAAHESNNSVLDFKRTFIGLGWLIDLYMVAHFQHGI